MLNLRVRCPRIYFEQAAVFSKQAGKSVEKFAEQQQKRSSAQEMLGRFGESGIKHLINPQRSRSNQRRARSFRGVLRTVYFRSLGIIHR